MYKHIYVCIHIYRVFPFCFGNTFPAAGGRRAVVAVGARRGPGLAASTGGSSCCVSPAGTTRGALLSRAVMLCSVHKVDIKLCPTDGREAGEAGEPGPCSRGPQGQEVTESTRRELHVLCRGQERASPVRFPGEDDARATFCQGRWVLWLRFRLLR